VDFEGITSSISNLVEATALMVGGGWAYLKFVRGRTFYSRARLELSADSYHYGTDRALVVHVSMQNEGLSKIDLSAEDEKFVRVDAVFPRQWFGDLNVDWDQDESLVTRTRLFERHGWLEPNETIEDQLLIPVAVPGRSDPIAYRITARVTQPPSRARRRKPAGQTWTADLILPVALTSEESTANQHVEKKGEVAHGI
jgi:hypothetical protein